MLEPVQILKEKFTRGGTCADLTGDIFISVGVSIDHKGDILQKCWYQRGSYKRNL